MIDVLILNSQNQAAMGCGRPPPPAPSECDPAPQPSLHPPTTSTASVPRPTVATNVGPCGCPGTPMPGP